MRRFRSVWRANQQGMAHYITPLVVVVGTAVVGTFILVATHADPSRSPTWYYVGNVSSQQLGKGYPEIVMTDCKDITHGGAERSIHAKFTVKGSTNHKKIDVFEAYVTHATGIPGPTDPYTSLSIAPNHFVQYLQIQVNPHANNYIWLGARGDGGKVNWRAAGRASGVGACQP